MVAVMQIGQQRADAGAKRRARLHARRCCGTVATATSPAARTKQFDAGHNRADRRQVDMIVAVAAMLGLRGYIGPAMAAVCRHDAFGFVRRLGQWAVLAFARRALASLGLTAFATALAKVVLRWRNMRIPGCLARRADQGFQLGNPRYQSLDHLVLREQQLVLLGFGQHMKRRR